MNANRKTILFPCGTLTEKKDLASTVCLIIISRVPDPNPVAKTSTDRGPIFPVAFLQEKKNLQAQYAS
jgi:hypothetical protein